ncbi:MAG: pyridoxal phosphate-dependent aminotransferase [Syntrophorhabdaceae bacterium]|nr:pyridoxal phosphate-dependent aminotransferase [Syntrophorhabdaceae bacterium]
MPAAKEIREVIANGSWIRKMFEEGAILKKERGEENIFDFTLGSPYGEPPPAFLAELVRLISTPPHGLHKYMPNAGYAEVRQAVARDLISMTGLPFTQDMVVMTAGAAGAINTALRSIISPGDEVLIFSPYFVEYIFYARNVGGVPVVVETDKRFQIDLAAVEAALTPKTRAIIINTPNNPSGAIYPQKTLAALDTILAAAERRFGTTIYVISDEPYRKIVYRGMQFTPPASMLRNTLICYSHSKDLNISGERIGYLAVSPTAEDADEIAQACVLCNRILGFVNAPSIFQLAVEKFQSYPADMSVYRENRDLLLSVFEKTGIECTSPGGAFYLFPKSPIEDEMEFILAAKKEGILLVPGSGFGRSGYFRVAFCVSTSTVRNSIPAWEQLVSKLRNRETKG